MVPYVVTDNSINLTLGGKMYVCQKSHVNFETIKKLLKDGEANEATLLNLIDIKKCIETFTSGKVKIENDILTYDGRELTNCLARRIIAMLSEGYTVAPLIKFLDNLMENPSARAVNEFYSFLERNKLPMTDDGCFLAYKKIRYDMKDIYSKTIDNSVGQTVELPRNAVDDEKERQCSFGLHFASFDYMSCYSSHDIDDRIIVVKINPRDVVAFPDDYNGAKGRCCRYVVVDEVKNDGAEHIKNYFAGSEDYGKTLEVLKFIKDTLNEKDVKYTSNFSALGLNNYAIRSIISSVRSRYAIPDSVEFQYKSLESVTVDELVKFVLAETP